MSDDMKIEGARLARVTCERAGDGRRERTLRFVTDDGRVFTMDETAIDAGAQAIQVELFMRELGPEYTLAQLKTHVAHCPDCGPTLAPSVVAGLSEDN